MIRRKYLLPALLLMVLLPFIIAPSIFQSQHKSVTVAQSATVSGYFKIPNWVIFIGALFPAMDDGVIGLEMSMNGGSNYYPVVDPTTGEDMVLVASGSDPAWVDFSDIVYFVPDLTAVRLRFTCASQTTGAVTINIFFKG